MGHAVFLSHVTSDEAVARAACAALEGRGISCWLAVRDGVPGADFPSELARAIAEARVVVVIVSRTTGASPHVERELKLAIDHDVPILPLRLGDVDVKGGMGYLVGGHTWLDIERPPSVAQLERLTSAAAKLLGRSSPEPAAPARAGVERAPGRRRRVLAGALAALVVLVGGTLAVRALTPPAVAPSTPGGGRAAGPEPSWFQGGDVQRRDAERLGVPVAFESPAGLRFVLIPGGSFWMGSPEGEPGRQANEGPRHQVSISSYYLSIHETTNAQVRSWRPDHDSGDVAGESLRGPRQPAVGLGFADVQEYVAWLRAREGGTAYRLPTEAEWEFACRAGADGPWSWGDALEEGPHHANANDVATRRLLPPLSWPGWPTDDGGRVTVVVGSYRPNLWGLYDLHGNAYEFVADEARPYVAAPARDPQNPSKGPPYVVRGGAWYCAPEDLRSARRAQFPGVRADALGFRVARSLAR